MRISTLLLLLLFSVFAIDSFSVNAYVFNGSGKSRAEKLAAITIAGIVNRDSAQLYLQDVFETWNYNQTDEKWRSIFTNDEKVFFTEINSIAGLIDAFKDKLQGAILYSESETYSNFPGQTVLWQGEFASMLGGLANAVPVPKGYETTWNFYATDSIVLYSYDNSDSLKIASDLTLPGWSWNNPALGDRYMNMLWWGVNNILPLCNQQSFFIREITDWAVQQKMFQLDISGNEPNTVKFTSLPDPKAHLIETLLQYFRLQNPDKLFHVYGWMNPEPLVQWISAYGGTFHEAMQANLSWFHVYKLPAPVPLRASAIKPDDVVLQNKYYIIFIGSEGDAGNWNMGFQAGAWFSPKRGQVPVAWGWNLHFFDQFPYLAYYYNKTATATDGFISVISPLGYTYSDYIPAETKEWAINKSKQLVDKFNITASYAYKHYNGQGYSLYRNVMISNYYDIASMSEFYDNAGIGTTFLFEPNLSTQTAYNKGTVLFNHVDDNTFYSNISNIENKKTEIINRLKTKKPPYFYLAGYQRFVGETSHLNGTADITLTELVDLKNMLAADPQIGQMIEFVTPEKFNYLIRGYMNLIDIKMDTSTATSNIRQLTELKNQVELCFKPAIKQLIISVPDEIFDNPAITVTDISGRSVLCNPVSDDLSYNKRRLIYNLQQLNETFYVATIITKAGNISKKIIVIN